MNIGIIGIGRIGKIHLQNCLTHFRKVKVLGAMNPSQSGRDYAAQMGVPLVTEDATELTSHPDIDAILVCSATDSHAAYVEQAAKAGKALFCEKPLDLSLDRVRQTLALVSDCDVPLMLAFNQRFDPSFAEAKQRIASGDLGRIRSLRLISRDPGPPPIAYIQRSGGMLMDMTIHDFDMARHQLDSEVVEVYAQGANMVSEDIKAAGDIDFASVVLTFANGAIATIENCRETSYGYDQRMEVFGSKGMIRVENPVKTSTLLSSSTGTLGGKNLDFFMDRYAESYRLELAAFFEALASGSPMPATGYDGLKAMEIAEAAMRSIAENRPVRLG
ncbi:Myo-inositol 2-dehydrogenase [Lunatimonas lonarensis]|uniref:Myo-inositol 2-dehydrogenase n=1 Tax=Lunatimonas lonarensis TaxID=1232681 RepID=R7ZWY7_9BACT|nr:inositol 2-dehydrogenase [Lunatimonas lonarensis]EON78656.1 Myo-inositol 2-dehydrogenase [Lunatimonas lonarensis]